MGDENLPFSKDLTRNSRGIFQEDIRSLTHDDGDGVGERTREWGVLTKLFISGGGLHAQTPSSTECRQRERGRRRCGSLSDQSQSARRGPG